MNRTWGVRFQSIAWFGVFSLAFIPRINAQASSPDTLKIAPPSPSHVAPPDPSLPVVELEQEGDELRSQKEYFYALDYYRAAMKKSPRSAPLYNKAGICELQTQRYTEANKDFERAIRTDKTFAISYNNLGVLEYKSKRYSKALGYYAKAIKYDASSASFYNNQGAAYFANREFESANVSYKKALELDPDIFERTSHSGISAQLASPDDRAHYDYVVAKLYAQTNSPDRSLAYLRRAMEEGYKGIGDVYKDGEFANLRKDPRFIELMKQRPLAISD